MYTISEWLKGSAEETEQNIFMLLYLWHTTRNQINDTFLFQNRVKVKVVGEVSEK